MVLPGSSLLAGLCIVSAVTFLGGTCVWAVYVGVPTVAQRFNYKGLCLAPTLLGTAICCVITVAC